MEITNNNNNTTNSNDVKFLEIFLKKIWHFSYST